MSRNRIRIVCAALTLVVVAAVGVVTDGFGFIHSHNPPPVPVFAVAPAGPYTSTINSDGFTLLAKDLPGIMQMGGGQATVMQSSLRSDIIFGMVYLPTETPATTQWDQDVHDWFRGGEYRPSALDTHKLSLHLGQTTYNVSAADILTLAVKNQTYEVQFFDDASGYVNLFTIITDPVGGTALFAVKGSYAGGSIKDTLAFMTEVYYYEGTQISHQLSLMHLPTT